jgi:hypothetical protein
MDSEVHKIMHALKAMFGCKLKDKFFGSKVN